MRSVRRTAQFRRDFKRVKRGVHGSHLDETLLAALELLAADTPLPDRYVDHPMKGRYADCRDCHLRPDLVLVYRKCGSRTLESSSYPPSPQTLTVRFGSTPKA